MSRRLIKRIATALVAAPLLWILFLFHCRPVVALHYSQEASDSIEFFFMVDYSTIKRGLAPGETVVVPTPMFPRADMHYLLSFPFDSADALEISQPFSRIDVCVGPGATIQRTETRHGFLARFTQPSQPCEPAAHEPNGRDRMR